MHKILVVIMIFVFPFTFGQNKKNSLYYNWIDLNKMKVIDFIKILPIKESKSKTVCVITTGNKAKVGWIKYSDLDTLISLIDSKEPAFCVMQAISSYLPTNEKSTIGGQVMNLIDAYRFKKEYPYFLTDCSASNVNRKADIINWWNGLKKIK